jgi:hypothetical protein
MRILIIPAIYIAAILAGAGYSEPAPDDILVGVSYFSGWWEPLPNKWHDREGRDWREHYPERVPLLGEYNTQDTVDKEIIAAAEHGVDFFAFLWYCVEVGAHREPNARYLNRGLERFLASPEAHRLRFIVEYVNHPPFTIEERAMGEELRRVGRGDETPELPAHRR